MKLRYILASLLMAALFVGCSDDDGAIASYGNISTDDTFITISEDGGDISIELDATEAWAFDNIFSLKVTIDGAKVTKYFPLPVKLNSEGTDGEWDWLTVNKLSGEAGTTTLTFHANAAQYGREAELRLSIGNRKQFIRVRQGTIEASPSTCKEVIEGPEGKTYQVTGTVTSIANTVYGNWYLNDGTGEVYIYGTLDAEGATKNFSSLGIEEGDIVTVEGPKKIYGSTIELVDVTVIKIVKTLVKVMTPDVTVSNKGGEFSVKVAYKGNGANFTIPEAAQSWLRLTGSKYIAGVKTIYDTATPADTTVFTFIADANEEAAREAAIEFTSTSGKNSSSMVCNVKQDGASSPGTGEGTKESPFDVPAALSYTKALGADKESTQDVYVKGKISSIKYTYSANYGTATYNISVDGTESEVFTVYGSYYFDNQPWVEGNTQIAVGDEVVVCGKVIYYGGKTPEFASKKNWLVLLNGKNAKGEEDKPVTPKGADGSTIISVADFQAAAESTEVWYQLTGTIKNLKDNDQYGNFDLEDATGSVYVYGVLSEKSGAKKQFQNLVKEKGVANGKKITIVGNRGSYNGKIEVTNAYFISVE